MDGSGRRYGCGWIPLLGLLAGAAQAAAPASATLGAAPFVQAIDASESGDHMDLSLQFACTVRYVGNVPLNHGSNTVITLRLGPDCGSYLQGVTPEFPLVGGGSAWVSNASVESVVPGEVRLELTWTRELDFVMASTANGQGLRVRLLGTAPKAAAGIVILGEQPEGYAINLESSIEPFSDPTVQAAGAELGARAYVSETDVEGQHWYRLRVGPFTTRLEAERVLRIASATHPRAWLAVGDEPTDTPEVERANVVSPASAAASDEPLPDSQRVQLLADARTALTQRQYAQAVQLLTRLLRQPEYSGRAEAQELIGLVHERAGQLAHAKAEDEEYLRRYPHGAAVERVRARLLALLQADQAAGTVAATPGRTPSRSSLAGSAAITYQYGRDQISGAGTNQSATSLNAFLVYGDLLMRHQGNRFDLTGRVDSGYTANMVANTGGSQDRTTAAFIQVDDRRQGLTGRLGRQSLANVGDIGLFDGLYVGYQAAAHLSLSAAAGFPAYTSYSAISGQQTFATLAAEFGPYHQAWVFDGYVFDQQDHAATERRALGAQARYSSTGRSAMLLADYDFAFRQLNAVTLIGNLAAGRWIFGLDADHRRSPLLLLSNALIGQSVTELSDLQSSYTPSQIRQLALDRTATSSTYSLSFTHPIAERWQLMGDVSALQLSGTPASAGVEATVATGLDKTASLQVSGTGLLQMNDLHFFGVRYDTAPGTRSYTLSWDARFVLPGAWRVGPRFSVERLQDAALGGAQTLYLPELRSDWTGRRTVFEAIGGYELQRQQTAAGQLVAGPESRHLYLSAAYRWRF